MLDTGTVQDTEPLYKAVRDWRPNERLVAAVFGHHHVDHIFGVRPFEAEARENGWTAPIVYGHETMNWHFDRYERMTPWNTAINWRQFARGDSTDLNPPSNWIASWPRPTVTYKDRLTFRVGEVTFELHHCRGETEDCTWTWVPERKLIHTTDLFIWSTPNCGNPQKVQRYPGDWSAGLRQMAGMGAEIMLAGHGLPILGADRIRIALSDTAEYLESLEGQTVALMNKGAGIDEIIHTVKVPKHLAEKPYLQPVYDHPEFIVRNVYRLYGGWHDGEPDHLLPAPRAAQAKEWVELAGGVAPVLKRVQALLDDDNPQLACHLIEFAVLAEPTGEVHALRTTAYSRWSQKQESWMARSILAHAALSSTQHERDLARARVPTLEL
jgi:alkyl sulfatase BDS1-like metallo-beta-lactamase superfamily hydrolase